MGALNHFSDILLTRLVWTSIQAGLLIGAVYLAGRLWPRLSAAMRCMLWWLVGAQLLLGLLWHAPLELPLLSPAPLEIAVAQVAPSAAVLTAATASDATLSPIATPATPVLSWRVGIALLWLAVLLLQALIALRQWRQARCMLRESQPLHDVSWQALCARQVRQLGLRNCPRLRVSDAIISPQVAGLWRPTVLLPAGHALSADEAAMAIAHELAHLRRGDLWLAWVPAIAQCLFCFHPLVHWAMREYALNRESACDAQVLKQGHAAPQDYGRLLLRLGVAQPMHAGLAGASPSFHNLKRRLTMLQQTVNQPSSRTRGWLLVALIALVGVLPYRVTAAGADNTPATPASIQASLLPSPPPAPPVLPLPPPPAPPGVLPPPPPLPRAPPHDVSGLRVHYANVAIHTDASEGFALFDGDAAIVNGGDTDLAAARRLERGGKSTIWFRRGDKAWLIDDPAYVQRARAAYAPVTEFGKQQGELGNKQGALGGRQGALGAQQGMLGAKQGQLAGQRAMLDGQRAMLDAQAGQSANNADRQANRVRLEASRQELEKQQEQLSQQQEALGRQQEALDKQQKVLDAEQAALGKRQQEATRQTSVQIRKLLDEAIAKGVAKPANAR